MRSAVSGSGPLRFSLNRPLALQPGTASWSSSGPATGVGRFGAVRGPGFLATARALGRGCLRWRHRFCFESPGQKEVSPSTDLQVSETCVRSCLAISVCSAKRLWPVASHRPHCQNIVGLILKGFQGLATARFHWHSRTFQGLPKAFQGPSQTFEDFPGPAKSAQGLPAAFPRARAYQDLPRPSKDAQRASRDNPKGFQALAERFSTRFHGPSERCQRLPSAFRGPFFETAQGFVMTVSTPTESGGAPCAARHEPRSFPSGHGHSAQVSATF